MSSPPIKTLSGSSKSLIAVPSAKNSGLDKTEKLLFSLPLAGSAFRKVYYDPNLGRPSGIFVPSEDVVVNYGASDLDTCDRATHVMRKSANDVRKLQVNGFYRDINLPDASGTYSDIEDKYSELTGEMEGDGYDKRHTLLEMQVNLDLKGFEDTVDGKETGIALPCLLYTSDAADE